MPLTPGCCCLQTHYELQNSVHRMTKEQLELNDVMSNFKAKLPLEMQDWQVRRAGAFYLVRCRLLYRLYVSEMGLHANPTP